MEEFLAYLVKAIVTEPDSVSIQSFEEEDGLVVLELTLAEGDYGRVIGREGRTIKALRTLLRVYAAGQDKNVTISLAE